MKQIKFVICLRAVYLTVVPLAHIIWCSVFRISGEPGIARDICDVVGNTVWNLFTEIGKSHEKVYCGQCFKLVPVIKGGGGDLSIQPRNLVIIII
jgi:spore maturation protein SpmA